MNNIQTAFDKLDQSVQDTMISMGKDQGMQVDDVKHDYNEAQHKLHGRADPWKRKGPK